MPENKIHYPESLELIQKLDSNPVHGNIRYKERVMLQDKELRKLHKSIQKRCRIQPGMLVKSSHEDVAGKLALVVKVSPACSFDRDYEGAEEHIFYVCEPFDGSPSLWIMFVTEQVS